MDIHCNEASKRPQNIRFFLYNIVIATAGVATCFMTIFPTFQDAAPIDASNITIETLLRGTFLPSQQFGESFVLPGIGRLSRIIPSPGKLLTVLESLALFGSTLGLIRRTGAFLAALTTLVGFSLFFVVAYRGWYRHQALWLVFMICMYWLAAPRNANHESDSHARVKPFFRRLSTAGTLLFVLVLLLQLPYGIRKVFGIATASREALDNRSNNVRSILAGSPELKGAVIIADPDFLLETLPYYVSNPTYLVREKRYGNVVHFTRKAQLELSLGDVLTNGRQLRWETRRPVVILLAHEIDPSLPTQVEKEGYNWTFTITPRQARDFQLSTRLLQHRRPSETSEEYYAYVLDK
jgi:hypothetical protein